MSEIQPNMGQKFKAFINNRKTFDSYSNNGQDAVFSYSKGTIENGSLQKDLVQFGKDYTATYDANSDGTISMDEFVKSENADYKKMFPDEPVKAENQKVMNAMYGATFEILDTDADKKLDSKEMTAYLVSLDGVDGNTDGNIQYSKFAAFSESLLSPNTQAQSFLRDLKNGFFGQQK